MKLRNALLAATVLAAPVAVHAQPVDGLYIGAGAGGNILQTEAVKRASNGPSNFGKGSDYRFDAGPVVVGSVGYGLGNGLRFELQGAFYDNKISRLKNGGAGVFRQTSAGGDEYKEGVFANVLYDVPLNQFGLNSPVFPYVGAGVGYVHNQINNGHIATVFGNGAPAQYLRTTGQNDNLGVQGIVGLSFPVYSLVPGLSLTAEYRFLAEIGGRSYNEQYFAPRIAVGTKQKFSTDDFNHSFLVGVRYAFNTPTPAVVAPTVAPQTQTVARTYLVFFDWDRADLTDRARQIVSEAAQASTRVQYTRIEVQGNADRSGTPAYNQRLSLRRAQTVAAELVRDGVPRTAIDIQAFGDTRPLVPTAAGVREPQNRRVAIILR
ncbi:OmpA family protein [Acidisphaera sp. L21]|uniref:OmpA family protein n=1 Tax=Acidisphaera sp. L21 TaxID=1641851 RepID=UPI00131D25A8|nr:OmpA family protein [Acidisphaera sp. L21]